MESFFLNYKCKRNLVPNLPPGKLCVTEAKSIALILIGSPDENIDVVGADVKKGTLDFSLTELNNLSDSGDSGSKEKTCTLKT